MYIARWTSVISEEVCDMGSYRTRRQPSVIRAHITHFFTYHTSPRVIYSLYHNNCPICLLFIEVLLKMSIKPSKTHEIKTWKITKYFCSYFGKTYHTLPQSVRFGQLEWYNDQKLLLVEVIWRLDNFNNLLMRWVKFKDK